LPEDHGFDLVLQVWRNVPEEAFLALQLVFGLVDPLEISSYFILETISHPDIEHGAV
jgi:hypothetical protein